MLYWESVDDINYFKLGYMNCTSHFVNSAFTLQHHSSQKDSKFNSYTSVKMTYIFCLTWDKYQSNVVNCFKSLRKEDDFYDVTLVGDDHIQTSAH